MFGLEGIAAYSALAYIAIIIGAFIFSICYSFIAKPVVYAAMSWDLPSVRSRLLDSVMITLVFVGLKFISQLLL